VGSKESSEIRGRFVGFSKNVGHALTFKILTDDTQKIIHQSQVRLASVGENNLKLDMEAGAVPERIYIRSKRDHTDPDVVLLTINAFASPFVSDKEELEAHKASAKSPNEPHSPLVDDPSVTTYSPIVETVSEDEDDESEDDYPPPRMTRRGVDESSVDSDDDEYQRCDWWTAEHVVVETVNEDEGDEPEEDDPPPMMARPTDDESSVDSDDDEYQRCDWWTGEHDDDYRSPYDNTPLKDMPCVEKVEPNHLQAPHTRAD
jgi:hypothetical protein